MKINSRTSRRTRVSFRGWAVWAASIVIILLLTGIVWTMVLSD